MGTMWTQTKGFRTPGWGITQEAATAVSSYFEWVAGHEQINQGINFPTQYFVLQTEYTKPTILVCMEKLLCFNHIFKEIGTIMFGTRKIIYI